MLWNYAYICWKDLWSFQNRKKLFRSIYSPTFFFQSCHAKNDDSHDISIQKSVRTHYTTSFYVKTLCVQMRIVHPK